MRDIADILVNMGLNIREFYVYMVFFWTISDFFVYFLFFS